MQVDKSRIPLIDNSVIEQVWSVVLLVVCVCLYMHWGYFCSRSLGKTSNASQQVLCCRLWASTTSSALRIWCTRSLQWAQPSSRPLTSCGPSSCQLPGYRHFQPCNAACSLCDSCVLHQPCYITPECQLIAQVVYVICTACFMFVTNRLYCHDWLMV